MAKQFYIIGKPIEHSKSPLIHNYNFQRHDLPHVYLKFQTDMAADVSKLIQDPDFGGASVTIPLKSEVIPLLDRLTPDAEAIGAVNTIVVEHSAAREGKILVGDNTDWQGIKLSIESHVCKDLRGASGLVIGAGGTSRAAIYALSKIGACPIYVANRNVARIEELKRQFPYADLQTIDGPQTVPRSPIQVAVSTVPADLELARSVSDTVEALLRSGPTEGSRPLFIEMAYEPVFTPLMQLADRLGWQTVGGLETLVNQGLVQYRLWTGLEGQRPPQL